MKIIFYIILFSLVSSPISAQTTSIRYNAAGQMIAKTRTTNTLVYYIEGNAFLCPNTAVELKVNAVATTYRWNTGATTRNITVAPTQNATYTVTITDANGCTTIKSKNISIVSKPRIDTIVGNRNPFPREVVTYKAMSRNGLMYQWFVTGGRLVSNPDAMSAQIEWTDSIGQIRVVTTNLTGCLSDTAQLNIRLGTTQQIVLPAGWNLVSTYLQLPNYQLPNAFNSLITNLLSVRDEQSQFNPAFPNPPFSTLTALEDGQGYWVQLSQLDTLVLKGFRLNPAQIRIPLTVGWNLIGYPCSAPQATPTAFASILSKVVKVKDIFDSFDPSAPPIFNRLDSLRPGGAYWVSMREAAELIYPTPLIQGARPSESPTTTYLVNARNHRQTAWTTQAHPNSMVAYGVVTLNDKQVQAGDVIGAFVRGTCRALETVRNQGDSSYVSMVINGTETDTIEFKLWNANKIYISNFNAVLQPATHKNELLPLRFNTVAPFVQVYPNPFEGLLKIKLSVEVTTPIQISFYDATGKIIHQPASPNLQVGLQELHFDTNSWASGLYYVRLSYDNQLFIHKIIKL